MRLPSFEQAAQHAVRDRDRLRFLLLQLDTAFAHFVLQADSDAAGLDRALHSYATFAQAYYGLTERAALDREARAARAYARRFPSFSIEDDACSSC